MTRSGQTYSTPGSFQGGSYPLTRRGGGRKEYYTNGEKNRVFESRDFCQWKNVLPLEVEN